MEHVAGIVMPPGITTGTTQSRGQKLRHRAFALGRACTQTYITASGTDS